MKATIIADDNFILGPGDKDLIQTKLLDKLDRHLVDFAADMKNPTIKISKFPKLEEYRINFNLWLPGKKHIYAEAKNEVFVSALVDLRNQIISQIKKYKEGLTSY